MLCLKKAFLLDVESPVTSFNQLECLISAECSKITLWFVYDVNSRKYLDFRDIHQKGLKRAVVVAQLAERSRPIPEDTGSNPDIGNFYWTFIYC